MKKFLTVTILSVAILIPTIQVEAAYVTIPNFYNITSNKIEKRIEYLGTKDIWMGAEEVKVKAWRYYVCDGKTDEYVAKYIRRLSSKHSFQLIIDDSALYVFEYTGSQARYIQKVDDMWHIAVRVRGDIVDVVLVPGIYPQSW